MNFLEKLDYLMEKNSLNKRKLSILSGIPYTTIDGFYKKGYENTKLSTARKLASALNVSLDYLIDDNIDGDNYKKNTVPDTVEITPEEAHLVDLYHELNTEGQEKLVDYADDMVRSGKYIKSDETIVGKEA